MQPLDKVLEATPIKVDTIGKDTVKTQTTTEEHQGTGQIDLFTPTTQDQGVSQIIVIE